MKTDLLVLAYTAVTGLFNHDFHLSGYRTILQVQETGSLYVSDATIQTAYSALMAGQNAALGNEMSWIAGSYHQLLNSAVNFDRVYKVNVAIAREQSMRFAHMCTGAGTVLQYYHLRLLLERA